MAALHRAGEITFWCMQAGLASCKTLERKNSHIILLKLLRWRRIDLDLGQRPRVQRVDRGDLGRE